MQQITLDDVFKGVVLVAAVVAAVDQLHRRLRRWLSHTWDEQLEGVRADISSIKSELSTNGGGSLKDEVRAIRRDLDARHQQNAERLDLVDSRLEDIDDKLARLGDAQKKLRRALLGHLRLGHRQAHTEEAQGIPDEVIEAIEDLDNDDERRGRRRNP